MAAMCLVLIVDIQGEHLFAAIAGDGPPPTVERTIQNALQPAGGLKLIHSVAAEGRVAA